MLQAIELKLSQILGVKRWNYLRLVGLLVRRELKVKYRGTILGYLWSMLNPLLFMLVITIVFSNFVRDIPNYNLFVLSGILAWNMASMTMNVGVNSIVNNSNLLRKVRIPIWVFPFVPLGTSVANLVLSLIPYSIIFLMTDISIPNNIIFFPIVLASFMVFLAGITLVLATFNVFFRDISHVLEPLLSLTFYATPIIYDRSGPLVPPVIGQLLSFNPFTHFIEAFRATVFGSGEVSLEILLLLILMSTVSLSFGSVIYKRKKNDLIFRL